MHACVHVYMRACWNGGGGGGGGGGERLCMWLGIDICSYAHVRFIPCIGFTLGCTLSGSQSVLLKYFCDFH